MRGCSITGLVPRRREDSLRAVLAADVVEEALELVVLRCLVGSCQYVIAVIGDGLAVRFGTSRIDGILRQIDPGVAGSALHLKSGRKMEGDLIVFHEGIAEIDGLLTMRAGEGVAVPAEKMESGRKTRLPVAVPSEPLTFMRIIRLLFSLSRPRK